MSVRRRPPRIALAHDYLREYGGAERVLEVLHALYPEAPVYTAFFDKNALGQHATRFESWDIRESWLTKIPLYTKLFSPLRIFSPQYFRRFQLRDVDVVISSTNAYFSKAIAVPTGAKHLCYCHTPARSLYGYTTKSDWKKNPVIRIFGEIINHYLRIVDVEIARENVDVFIANSAETSRRIKKFYKLPSTIIYPPCEVPNKEPLSSTGSYYLYVNRLALAKHPELAVEAANRLHLPLKIAGQGPLLDQLRKMAGPTVEILGGVSDAELKQLYQGAKTLLYPVEDEDFGMIPVEAMGYGIPVIAHRSGGPQETIIEGKTGVFFEDLTTDGLVAAIQQAETKTWSKSQIWKHAQRYSVSAFKQAISDLVETTMEQE